MWGSFHPNDIFVFLLNQNSTEKSVDFDDAPYLSVIENDDGIFQAQENVYCIEEGMLKLVTRLEI